MRGRKLLHDVQTQAEACTRPRIHAACQGLETRLDGSTAVCDLQSNIRFISGQCNAHRPPDVPCVMAFSTRLHEDTDDEINVMIRRCEARLAILSTDPEQELTLR